MKTIRRILLGALLILASLNACATHLVQEFFVPLPEDQVQKAFKVLYSGVGAQMNSVISIEITANNTIINYDHWEDGYEVDLENPTQSTTEIWGDGNDANGIPPGFAHDPSGLAKGTVISLRNTVDLPRDPSVIKYDGRDRIGASIAVVASRAEWATNPGTVLAGAAEMISLRDYGTDFKMPVGQNLSAIDNSMFNYVGMLMVAAQDGTNCTYTDVNNVVTTLPTLNTGSNYQLNGGVKAGDHLSCNNPVQVHLITGKINGGYESRWYLIYPTTRWSSDYYTPAGTSANNDTAYVFVFNPDPVNSITVNYETLTGTGSFSVAANSTSRFQMPVSSGGHFYTSGADFYAVAAMGATPSANNVHDWGFLMVPKGALTTEAVAGWAPGNGNLPPTDDGSPLWVTAPNDTTVYVDYHGDGGPNTAANGQTYDVAVSVNRLQSVIIAAPNHDNTGTRLFTTDGTLVSAAWGQNSAVAGPGAPYLDMGTAVLPFPVPSIIKTSALMTSGCTGGSNDTNGIPAVNECLHYTLTVDNAGLTTLDAALLQDDLGSGSGGGLTYQPGTAMLNGTPIPDGPGNSFPLAAPGYLIEGIPPGASSTVTYDAKITWAGATPHSLTNNAFLNNPNISASYTVILPPTIAAACNLNFTDSGGTTVTTYSVGDTLYVTLSDADLAGSGTTTVVVTNPANGSKDTETLTLTETSSGVFTGSLPSSSTAGQTDNDGTLFMQVGDAIQVASSYPTCSAATANVPPPTKTKTLYLTGVAQNLTRTVPTNASATSTATLNTGSAATIAIGGTTTGSSSGVLATSLPFSHTPGSGSNRLLLVAVATGSPNNTNNAGTVSGVKFNGVSMNLLGSALNGAGGTTGVNSYIYYLKDADINTSSAANVVVSTTLSTIAASATTFTGVDQTTPMGTYASNTGDSATVALASAYASATGEVVYSVGGNEQGTTNRTIATPVGQTQLWNVSNHQYVDFATSTKPGAASVSPSYTLSTTRYWTIGAVSIKPATTVGNPTATFTQTPTMASGLTIPAGTTLAARAYYTVATGSMPASPSITATLKYGATTIATSSSASASATTGSGLLTFSFPAQAGTITVPSGQAITLDITTAQSGVTFTVDYDSTATISKVDLPTTTVITVDSLALYDGPYPGGSVVTTANNGQTLYVRSTVSDPFGAYDITGEDLVIDGPGSSCDLTPTLGAGNVVNTTTTSKTYEYAWSTAACEGAYTVTATAHEGTEGTVTATDSTQVNLSALDTGTPGIIQFVDGSDADKTSYTTSQQVCLKVTDLDQAGRPEPIQAYVTGSISGAQSAFTLTETPANSGVFEGCFGSPGSSSPFVNGDVLNAGYTDPNDPSDVATDTALVTNGAVPSLIITKTRIAPADGVAIVGESVQYNISVTNPGVSSLATVTLSDTYSSSCYTFQSASLTPDTNAPGTLGWNNVGPIAGGATVNLSVTLTAKAACDSTAATNSVSASGSASAGPATATATLNNPAVTVSKTLTSAPTANIGDSVTFHIVVTNSGNTNLTTVPLSDNYSSCLQYVSATPAATSAGGGTALWSNLGALAAGANTTVDTTFKVVGACASAQNTAEVDFAVDVNGDTAVPGSGSDTVTTQAASISGQVVNDNGAGGGIVGDGIKNGTESGIAGVNIKLYLDPNGDGDLSDAGTPVAVTTTDAGGNYSILGLALDTGSARYVIVETDPSGYQSTSPLSNKLIVDVAAIQDYPNEDFFDVRPDISGQVRSDVDNDGDLADAESGIPGVTVTLYTDVNSNGIYDSGTDTVFGSAATTDANGNYRFFGVPAGHYVVVETDPAGMTSTNDADGNAPVANGFNTIAINFAPAAPSSGNDFLDYLPLSDISSSIACVPATATVGSPVQCTLSCTNSAGATAAATGVSCDFTGTPPAGAVASGCPATSSSLAIGASLNSCSLTFTPGSPGTIPLTGTGSATNESDTSNNDSSLSLTANLPIPPQANNDSATTNYGVAVTLPVLANDAGGVDGAGVATVLDPATLDLDPGTAGEQTSLSLTGMGTFTLNGDGTVTFMPVTGFYGVASIPYTVEDNLSPAAQMTNTALITVTVAAPPGAGTPAAPVANDDFAATLLNTPVTIGVLTNDAGGLDSGGSATTLAQASATVTLGAQPPASTGVFSVNGDGTVTFTPNATFTGAATITYTVTDSIAQTSNSATITVMVTGGSVPVASPDAVSMKVTDASVTLAVLDNDAASNGATLDASTVDLDTGTAGVQGSLSTAEGDWTANADGTVSFVPASDYNSTGYPFTGTATLPYAVTDSSALTAQSTLTVIVTPVAVTAQDDSASTAYDTNQTVDVSGNDSAAAGAVLDPTTVVLDTDSVTPGVQAGKTLTVTNVGTWTVNGDGTVTFDPDPGFTDTASVLYQISDSLGNVATATLTMLVGPDAVDDSGAVVDGTAGGASLANVLTNDSQGGSSPVLLANVNLTQVLTSDANVTLNPADGSVNVAAGTAAGVYNVSYQICDKANPTLCDTATVSVPVVTIDAVNDSGATVDGTAGGTSLASVLANDSQNGSSPVVLANVNLTQVSTTDANVTLNTADGSVNVAAGTAAGNYTVTYKICDAANPAICDTATVSVPVVTIDAVNDSGAAVDGTAGGQALANVLINDSQNGSSPVVLANVNLTQVSTTDANVTLNTADGSVNVAAGTASGNYTVTYQICDKANPTVCDTATVSVPVVTIDAVNDSGATVDGTAGGQALANVLINDSQNGSSPVVLANVNLTQVSTDNANVTLNTADGSVNVAAGTASGNYTVTYQICDAANPTVCDTATVSVPVVTIDAVNDSGATVDGTAGGQALANVLINDSQNGSSPVVLANVNLTQVSTDNANVTLNTADGSVNAAAGTASGNYTVTYQICDAANPAVCDTATVTVPVVTIDAVNDSGATVDGTAGGTSLANVLANDSQNGSSPVILANVNLTQVSTTDANVTLNPADGSVNVAASTAAGSYTVTYRICDAANPTLCDTATVTVPVRQPIPPLAVNDSATTNYGVAVTLPVLANDAGGVDGAGVATALDAATVDLDPGTAGEQTSLSLAGMGTFTLNGDGTVTFMPVTGFYGVASIPYTVRDNHSPAAQLSNAALITVTVAAPPGAGTPIAPVANDDFAATLLNTPVTIGVLTNDAGGLDSGGSATTLAAASATVMLGAQPPASTGVFAVNGDGTVTFTPNATYTGAATISYTVTDSIAQTSNSATITVMVTGGSVPVASPDAGSMKVTDASVTLAVLDNDAASNGATLDAATVDLDTGNGGIQNTMTTPEGDWTANGDGTVSFVPASDYNSTGHPFTGTATLPYAVTDSSALTAQSTLTVIVTPVAVTAQDDSASTAYDTNQTVDVSGNDSAAAGAVLDPTTVVLDTDSVTPGVQAGKTLTVTNVGTWTVNGDGTVTFDPDAGFTDTASVLYQISDSLGNVATATLTITVGASILPITDSGSVTAGTGGTAIANVASNDTVNGSPATLGGGGNATVATSGSWPTGITLDTGSGAVNVDTTVAPGVYDVTYQLCDLATPTPNCATVQDTVTVNAAIDPVTDSGSVTAGIGGTAIANVAGNDTVNGSPATLGGGGNATVATSGSWPTGVTLDTGSGAIDVDTTVAPGVYYVTYQLCDLATPTPNCATVQDTVTVNAAVDPVTESGSVTAGIGGTAIANVASNDTVNGLPATLGGGGNATVATSGSWPTGITLDTGSGAINVATTVAANVYHVTYQLCDLATPTPNCATVQDTVTVSPPVVNTGSISGHIWYDTNHDNIFEGNETGRAGWTVELLDTLGHVIAVTTTAGDGSYSFTGLADGTYSVYFSDASSGLVPVNGEGGTPVTNGGSASPSKLSNIVITGGAAVPGQGLPVDPSGVVYDSHTRQPIGGAVVTLSGPVGFSAVNVAGGSLSTITSSNGAYAFILLNTAPDGTYSLSVSRGGYKFPSTVIHPSNASSDGYTGGDVSGVNGAPSGGQSTKYYLSFPLPTQDMINNNIPLDPSSLIPVPSISGWGMIILSFLLVFAGAVILRRQRL